MMNYYLIFHQNKASPLIPKKLSDAVHELAGLCLFWCVKKKRKMQNNKINFVKKKLKHGCITDDFFFQKFAENGLDLKLGIISVK